METIFISVCHLQFGVASMSQNDFTSHLTFNDLFDELKLEIFKYLTLNERIICQFVSREWSSLLSQLSIYQKTLVIGEPLFDSTDRMKLSLCNINARHIATPSNTIYSNALALWNDTADGQSERLSQLLQLCRNVKALFIYAPIRMKLSDLTDRIEHIHFGHNVVDAIVFDKTDFPSLRCISTIDAHLDEKYINGIVELLNGQKLQMENVSVCEVPGSLCQEIIEMKNLKQLYVFDFNSDFDSLYMEKSLEILDAHPKLQYFNMFVCPASDEPEEPVCPTSNIRWLMEFGSKTEPLQRRFVMDVFYQIPFDATLEFSKEYLHGLHLVFPSDIETATYETTLSNLHDLRLSYQGTTFKEDSLRLSLEHHLKIAPNLRNVQVRLFRHGMFDANTQWVSIIVETVAAYAQKNSGRSVVLELSAFGNTSPCGMLPLPKNLQLIVKPLREY